ncbi:hypothetical protein BC826DRAFT_1060348 [Russula brevipes]|nr:hypothetical protein BC826DRAFT_1060348 [Russula brevipes]
MYPRHDQNVRLSRHKCMRSSSLPAASTQPSRCKRTSRLQGPRAPAARHEHNRRRGAPGGTLASFFAMYNDVLREHLRMSMRNWALFPVPGGRSSPSRLVYRLSCAHEGGVFLFGAFVRLCSALRACSSLRADARRARVGEGPRASPWVMSPRLRIPSLRRLAVSLARS